MRTSRWIVGITVCLLLVLLPGGLFALMKKPDSGAPWLSHATAQRGLFQYEIQGEGALVATRSEPVYAQVDALVSQVHARGGAHVARGEALLSLRSEAVSTALQQAADARDALDAEALKSARMQVEAGISGYVKAVGVKAGDTLEGFNGPLVVLSSGTMVAYLTLPKGVYAVSGDVLALSVDGFGQTAGEVLEGIGHTLRVRVTDMGFPVGTAVTWIGGDGSILATGALSIENPSVILGLDGMVEEVFVAVGDYVSPGKPLLTLIDLAEAEAIYSAWSNGKTGDTLAAALEMAEWLTVTAPIDGLLEELGVAEGQQISAGDVVARVIRTDPYAALLHVHEAEIAKVRAGQTVTLALPALGQQVFESTVSRVLPEAVVKEDGIYYTVEVLLAEVQGMLPGMSAAGSILAAAKTDAVMVPLAAVRIEGGMPCVLLMPGEGALKGFSGQSADALMHAMPEYLQPVTLGMANGTHVEVLSGLSGGEEMVLFERPVDLSAYLNPVFDMQTPEAVSVDLAFEEVEQAEQYAILIDTPDRTAQPTETVQPVETAQSALTAQPVITPSPSNAEAETYWPVDYDVPWPEG